MRVRAYTHLQQKIASGELEPGTAISEPSLAKQLGISRTPIREAIGQLAAEGWLEQTPHRGAVVVKFTRQDIVDLYELREALEVFAVSRAASLPVRPDDMERLERTNEGILRLRNDLIQGGAAVLDPQQMHQFLICDLNLHTLLMSLAANARIVKVVNDTRLLIRIFELRHEGHSAEELNRIYQDHREVLDAVAQRDPQRATRVLAAHIQASRTERLLLYDQWERENSLRKNLPVFFDLPNPLATR